MPSNVEDGLPLFLQKVTDFGNIILQARSLKAGFPPSINLTSSASYVLSNRRHAVCALHSRAAHKNIEPMFSFLILLKIIQAKWSLVDWIMELYFIHFYDSLVSCLEIRFGIVLLMTSMRSLLLSQKITEPELFAQVTRFLSTESQWLCHHQIYR